MSASRPTRVRALAESLIGCASVSPHPAAENACADLLARALPPRVEQGREWTPDQRAVVWAHVPGRSRRVTLLLGHHDTVGVDEFGGLGAPQGVSLAFAPEALRETLLAHARRHGAPESVGPDLAEERARPGTWLFGRGALDMKSGLAAGATAFAHLSAGPPPETGVLFVSCPDEEVGSAGMRALALALPRWLGTRNAELAGVLNLDFTEGPHAHAGAMGKLRVMLWVLGAPTHVGAPFLGVDAAFVAAALARALPLATSLVDPSGEGEGTPAAVLRLRDLKERYDVQTAPEAVLELNVLTRSRGPEEALLAVRDAAREALAVLAAEVRARAPESRSWREAPAVLTYAELAEAAGAKPGPSAPGDPTALAIAELRALAGRAGFAAPAVVVALLPPFYPHAAPGDSGFTRAVAQVLEDEGVELKGAYPFITDASLVAGDARLATAAARWMPGAMRDAFPPPPLGAEVVNLGPWGRDAHGLWERVRTDWAFERLPLLIERVLRAV